MTGWEYIRVTLTGLKISEILDWTRIFLMSAQPITGDRMRNWVCWVSARYNGGFPGARLENQWTRSFEIKKCSREHICMLTAL
jgi:hypothetical protein